MPGNPGVVMLLQDPTAKVFVPRDDNLAAEIEQPTFDVPFGRPGGPGSSGFKEVPSCESHGFLEVWFAGECLSDVPQKGDLWAGYHDALQRTDLEQGGT
jgi:hypothetical protein